MLEGLVKNDVQCDGLHWDSPDKKAQMARSRQILLLVDRLQDILEEYSCDACTDNGSQNVDPEPSAYGIGKGRIAPSGKVGHQSGTEVAGGIKAALRNGCDEEDDAAHGEADVPRTISWIAS